MSLSRLLGLAVRGAAEALARRDLGGERILEAGLEAALQAALGRALPGRVHLEGRKRKYPIPDWDPLPGGVDVVIYHEPERLKRHALIECKWSIDGDNIFETLHDLFKMVSGTYMPDLEGAFLVVGAPVRLWSKPSDCAELFPANAGEQAGPFGVCDLIDCYRSNWEFLRRTSAGCPARLPREVGTTAVAVEELEIHDKEPVQPWQLRCVEVEPRSDDMLTLTQGWCA